MRDAAGELADRLHLLRLAQGFFGLLALGNRLRNAGLQRLVEVLYCRLGALACRDVLEQYGDLAPAGGLDTERSQFEIASGGDELALEADRYPGPQHAAVKFGPAIGLVGHHLAQLLPYHIGDAGMHGVGRVGFDMDVVAQRTVGTIEEFDDAETLVDGIEEGTVALLAVGKRGLGAFQLAVVGDRERVQPGVLRL